MATTVLSIRPSDEPRVAGKMGRLDARVRVFTNWLASYGKLPDAPSIVQRAQFAELVWQMLGNTQYGDCTFAGYVHVVMACAALLGITINVPTAAEVVRAYLTFTGGQNTGCVEATVLGAAYKTGLVGFRLAGYAPINGGLPELWQAVNVFGSGYLGVSLTQSDMQQFEAGEPWHLTSTRTIIGGHCIPAVEYDQDNEMAKIVSWAREQLVEFSWLRARMDEAWAVIPLEVKRAGGMDGFDWAALEADMQSIHGTVLA